MQHRTVGLLFCGCSCRVGFFFPMLVLADDLYTLVLIVIDLVHGKRLMLVCVQIMKDFQYFGDLR